MKPNGGPAFPLATGWKTENYNPSNVFEDSSSTLVRERDPGMSVRDYFMAHAPISLRDISDTKWGAGTYTPASMEDRIATLVKLRGEYADAMIAEREKP